MARSLDEVRNRPAEAPQSFEYQKTEEALPLQPQSVVPGENRTFAFDEVQTQPAPKKESKTKKLTVVAAVFAAAGITLFAGMTTPADMLRMQPTTEVTETTETTDATDTTEFP